ncbi:MAG: helix-turn-helix transcriptional regulator [Chloroflexota bacterium]
MKHSDSFLQRFLAQLNPSPAQLSRSDYLEPLIVNLRKIEKMAAYEDVDIIQVAYEITAAGIEQRQRYMRSMRIWHTLTPKELEVTALICLELSNEEIARELHIAPGTVKAHVHNILKKFEAESRYHVREQLMWWDAGTWNGMTE